MRKIPTLFERDPDDRAHVLPIITEGCEWVLAGEGTPTRKYDGTCVMFDGAHWWARRTVSPGKQAPMNFRQENFDSITRKTVGWEPADQSPFWKPLQQALGPYEETQRWNTGTYELCGPKINGNPEHLEHHELFLHDAAQPITLPQQRDFKTLRRVCTDLLRINHVEGIVFVHPDGRRCKLKGRDFRRDEP